MKSGNQGLLLAIFGVAPICLALSACDAVAPRIGGADSDDEYACIETVTELAGLDSALPNGKIVRDLVGPTLGVHEFVLKTPPKQKQVTTYTPDSNGVKGEMELSFGTGKVRYVEAKRPELPKGLALALYCPNRLEVDVSMKFHSQDGAFAEMRNTVLHRELNASQNPGLVDPERLRQIRLSVDFSKQPLVGSFKIATPSDFTPANTQSHQLVLRAIWEDDKLKESDLQAGWTSKPVTESPGESSQFSTGLTVYTLDFAKLP